MDILVNPLQGKLNIKRPLLPPLKTPVPPPFSLHQKFPSMEEDEQREELQLLLPTQSSLTQVSREPLESSVTPPDPSDHPQLDLNLSMSIGPLRPSPADEAEIDLRSVQALKQQATEQIQLATVEKAYAERVRELTRRELELAEKEFSRARLVWERARDDVEKVERMKVMATRKMSSNCIEITCQACRQRFQP